MIHKCATAVLLPFVIFMAVFSALLTIQAIAQESGPILAETESSVHSLRLLLLLGVTGLFVTVVLRYAGRRLREKESVAAVRDAVVNLWIISATVFAPVILALSLIRSVRFGWTFVHSLHLVICFSLVLVTIYRKRLSYSVRAWILLSFLMVGSISGLLTYGLVGPTLLPMFVLVVAAVTFFGIDGGIVATMLAVLSIAGVSLAVRLGLLRFAFEVESYATSGSLWDFTFVLFGFYMSLVNVGIGSVYALIGEVIENKRASENQFRTLVESANSIILRLDLQGRITFFNQFAQDFFGYDDQEVMGKSVVGLIVPETESTGRDLAAMIGDIVVHPDKYKSNRNENIRKDGERVWVSWANKGLLDSEGSLCEILCIGNDVTELKRAEDALRESETRYRSLFENAHDGIFLMKGNIFIDCNNKVLEMFGGAREEIIGNSPEVISPPKQPDGRDSEEKAREKIHSALAGEPQFFQWLHWKQDRTPFHVEVSLNRVLLSGEYHLLAIVRDITERINAEELLRESEEFRRRVFDSSRVPVFIMDPESFVFIDCNPVAAEIVGFSTREEVLGKTALDVSADVQYDGTSSEEKARFYVDKAMKEGTAIFEWRPRRPNGEEWDAELHLMKFQSKDKPLLQFVVQDVTERKKAQMELERERLFSETVIDSLPGIFYMYDQDLRLRRWNRNHEISTGYSSKELEGKFIGEWHSSEEMSQKVVRDIRGVLDGDKVEMVESTLRHKDGRDVPYLLTAMRIDTPKGPMMMGVGIDISDRVRAEEALRDREKELSDLVDTSRDWIWSMDKEGKHTFSNPAVREILGYEPGEVRDRSVSELIHEDDRPMVEKSLRDWVEHKQGWQNVLIRWRCKDGGYRLLESSAVPILDRGGNLLGFRGVDRDVTEREQAHARMQMIAQTSSSLLAGTPSKQQFAAEARRVRETFEVDMCVIRTLDHDALVLLGCDGESCDLLQERIENPRGIAQEIMRERRPLAISDVRTDSRTAALATSRPGHYFFISFAGAPLMRDNRVIGIVGIYTSTHVRDFSEADLEQLQIVANNLAAVIMYQRLYENLAKTERLLSAAIEQSPSGIIIADAPDARIRIANMSALNIRGETDTALTDIEFKHHALNWQTFWLDGTPMKSEDIPLSRAIFKGEVVKDSQFIVRRDDGQDRFVSANAAPVYDDQGEIVAGIVVFHDITERIVASREAELRRQQLIQADKMISLGTLVAGVAHEINNPNTFIMFNTPMLGEILNDLLPRLDEYREEHGDFPVGMVGYDVVRKRIPTLLEGIKDGAIRIRNIVSSLKDFARQDVESTVDEFSLNDVVRVALILTQNSLKRATRNLRVTTESDLPTIRGNRQQIEQVLINLIANACDALTDSRQAIRIATHYWPERNAVSMSVEDEGKGIPEGNIPFIIDPFYTTKRDSGGTGLGLSISDGIVRAHGGIMIVESWEGVGTHVTVDFPLESEENNEDGTEA